MIRQPLTARSSAFDGLLVKDALTGLDKLPTGENDQHQDCENDLSCHFFLLLLQSAAVTSTERPSPAVIAGAVSEEPYRDDTPQPAGPVDRNRANRVVYPKDTLDKLHTQTHNHPGGEADDRGADGINEAARGRNRYQTREQAIARHRGVGLAETDPHVKQRCYRTRASGKHRVDRDQADSQVPVARSPEGAPWIKPEPAEGEYETPEEDHRHVMPRHRIRLASPGVLSNTRSDNH